MMDNVGDQNADSRPIARPDAMHLERAPLEMETPDPPSATPRAPRRGTRLSGPRSHYYAMLCRVLPCLAAMALLLALLIVMARDGRAIFFRRPRFTIDWNFLAMLMVSVAMEAFLMTWFFALGGCLGSFLNVVVYRIPRGGTLWGSSHCPHCNRAIRSMDNLPILGWFGLRGRCRDCRRPIATRYVSIELFVAVVFLLLASFELAFPGFVANRNALRFNGGFVHVMLEPDGLRWVRFAAHMALLLTILAAWLMRRDGHTLRLGFLKTAWILQLIAVSVLPLSGPLGWNPSDDPLVVSSAISASGLQIMSPLGSGGRASQALNAIILSCLYGVVSASVATLIYGVWGRGIGRPRRLRIGLIAGLVGWTTGIPWGVGIVLGSIASTRVDGAKRTEEFPGAGRTAENLLTFGNPFGSPSAIGIDGGATSSDTAFLARLFWITLAALLVASQTGSADIQLLRYLQGPAG